MKRVIFTGMLFLFFACGQADSEGGVVIYAQFVTHNERSPHTECDPVTTTESGFLQNRPILLEYTRTIVEHGGAIDVQSDYQYIQAVQQWDPGTDTWGKNVLQYLAEMSPRQLVVEAHGHVETGPNYADIEYLLSQVGVRKNGVAGGFVTDPSYNMPWTAYEAPVTGRTYPEQTWVASILWGSPEWQGDDTATPSGVWRPSSSDFYTHDPAQRLIFIGRYWKTSEGLADLIEKARNNQLVPGIYTVSIYAGQCALTSQTAVDAAAIIDQYAGDVAAGRLVWATIPDVVRIWQYKWSGQPNIYRQ